MEKRPFLFEKYIQVFDDKHGFINNLSVLDLLFNEGKFAFRLYEKPKTGYYHLSLKITEKFFNP
jgi:hypothetical protein